MLGSENAQCGGAYVSFFVAGGDVRAATTSLFEALSIRGWKLTSLMKMMCAFDFEEDDAADHQFDALAAEARVNGVALSAFHTFPQEDQRPQ
jgi:hypothetical protein